MGVPTGPQGLLYGVVIDPQGLSYGGTHRSSRAIIGVYSYVLKGYYMGYPYSIQEVSFVGTHRFSTAIIGGTQGFSRAIIEGVR